jgi:hypothetical protein
MNERNVRSQLGCNFAMKQAATTGYPTLKQKAAVGLDVTTRHKE